MILNNSQVNKLENGIFKRFSNLARYANVNASGEVFETTYLVRSNHDNSSNPAEPFPGKGYRLGD